MNNNTTSAGKNRRSVSVSLRTQGLLDAISELELHITKFTDEGIKLLLGLFDPPSKLARFECGPASVGTGVSILLEPSDLLLDLLSACWAVEFHDFIVKYAHDVVGVCFYVANVKGDASARGTSIQLGSFSPSHPPACSTCRFEDGPSSMILPDTQLSFRTGQRHSIYAIYSLHFHVVLLTSVA